MDKVEKSSFATGRRKSATATSRFSKTSGILINGRIADQYFLKYSEMQTIMRPLVAAEIQTSDTGFAIKVSGGGTTAQSDAVKLSLSRLLAKNGKFDIMKEHDLLRADCRKKERKKYGMKGPRAKRQFSKR